MKTKERVEFPKSIENEVKIAKSAEAAHASRDEVIAKAIDLFLQRWGL